MKKIISLILLFACVLSLTGCSSLIGKTDVDRALNLKETSNNSTENLGKKFGISFDVKKITPTGATLYFIQSGENTKGVLQTGKDFKLEKLDDGKWKEIKAKNEPNWDMSAIAILKGEKTKMEIDWEWLYGELSAGRYKISKSVTDFVGIGNSETQTFFYEFELK